MNTETIERRCLTFVPGVSVTCNGTLDRRQWVDVIGTSQSVRFVLVHGLGEPSWEATIKVSADPEQLRSVDEIEDVVRVLWVAFGSLVYPRVLWEVLEADASCALSGPKIWLEARNVLLYERGFIEGGPEFQARQAALFSLHMALASREVQVPADLVVEAVAMATSGESTHHSWRRPTIKREDWEKIAP